MSAEEKKPSITSITIENFKGIGASVNIPIKPITLLFGQNSAGKSTISMSSATASSFSTIWWLSWATA